MTDNPESRKRRDDSGDAPGKYLGPEIHRKLSEASEHPKEHEKEAQEKPDRIYLNEDVRRELSEASRQDERINQPIETTRTGGIDAEPEHSVVQREERRLPGNSNVEKQTTQGAQQEGTGEHIDSSEQPLKSNLIPRELNSQSAEEGSGKHEQAERPAEAKRTDDMDAKLEQIGEPKDPTVRQIYEIQEHESCLPEKGTASEQLAGKEGQTIPETQTEKTREPQVERPDYKPPLSDPLPHESSPKAEGRESASEHPLEQDLTEQDKSSHEHLTDEAHEKSSERSQPSEQSITLTELTGNRSLNKPDHESCIHGKVAIPEWLVGTEKKTHQESTPEKGGEQPVELANHAKGLHADIVPHELAPRSESGALALRPGGTECPQRPATEPQKLAELPRRPAENLEPPT